MSQEQLTSVPDEVLQAFYGKQEVSIASLSGGLVNQTYRVQTEQGEQILQSLAPLMEPTIIDSVVVMHHMKNEGWEVPSPVLTQQGDYSYKDERGTAWRAMTYIESEPQPAKLSYQTLAAAGHVLGRWHNSLAKLDYQPKGELPHFHDAAYHVDRLGSLMDTLPKSAADLGAKVLSLYEDLPAIPEAQPQLIHGDPKFANMLYRDGKPFTLIDYDTLMSGSVWLDVGDLLRSVCSQRLREGNQSAIYGDLNIVGRHYMKARQQDYHDSLPLAARLATQHISLELSARYLNDIVDDDYFAWDAQQYASRAEHHHTKAAMYFKIAGLLDGELDMLRA